MFSHTPSSTSAFGSPLLFGQTSNSNASSTIPFGSQYMSGHSSSTNIFGPTSTSAGGTSMGLFGSKQGTSSSPIIWGSSSGSSTNSFGSRVGFGQNINPNVSSTGSSGSQYTFGQGSNLFGSAPSNGGTSARAFGGSLSGRCCSRFGSAPNNGGTSTDVFGGSLFGQSSNLFGSVSNNGDTSMGLFGQTASSSPFGQRSNIFGSVPNNSGTSMSVFGQTASSSSFGQGSNIFGSVTNNSGTSTGLFATTPSTSPFGFQHTFGSVPASVSSAPIATSSSPILWISSTGSTTSSQVRASIASSSSGFGSGCMTSSGQTTVPWDRSHLSGTNTFSFGTQSSSSGDHLSTSLRSGNQVRAPIIGPLEPDKSSFGEKRGSRVTSYSKTTTKDDKGERYKLVSICAMPTYQNKSHEELRWEDNHQFHAGGLNHVPPSVPSNPFSTTVTTPSLDAVQPHPTPFSPLISPNSFYNNPCSAPSTSVTQPVSIFEPNKSPSIISLPTPTAPQYPSINTSSAGAASIVGPNSTTSFPSSSYMCSTVTAPVTVSVPCTAAPETASGPATFWSSQASQTRGLNHCGFDGLKGVNGQTTFDQQLPSQNTEVKQSPIANPFGTQSAVPQMITEGIRTAPPVKYGISSIPICDKPAPARSPSLLNIRHLSYHRQRCLPIQKYKPKSDGPKVAFFDDAQKTATTAKKEAPLLPRSNPRAFISGHYEELNSRVNFNNTSFEKNSSTDTYKNGEVELSAPDQVGFVNQDIDEISSETDAAEHNRNTDSVYGDHPIKKEISSNVYELMPKLKNSDYFFEPRAEELATKESYEPGFCSHVKGFVVGRQGYGSIKFLEETDVRELDLESYIEFRNREVIVYMDESKKPPVGQGLNKAAEITLCNIKVVDKKTGKQYVNGPNVDNFKEKLMKKTAQQGAEFVSYNPVQGEWKFRVQHF